MKYTAPYPVASVRILLPPNSMPLPVSTPTKRFSIRLYCPNKYPISRAPTPMSPAGTSVVFTNMPVQLRHKGLAKSHDLVV